MNCYRIIQRWKAVPAAVIVLLGTVVASPNAGFSAEVPRYNIMAEFVNFETPMIKPLLVTADGKYLVALNEPDDRVVVRDAETLELVTEVVAGQGLRDLAQRPGSSEIWVSAMHSAAVVVIDTDSWQVTHTLKPPAIAEAGTGDAAEPGGIAFSADGAKAWVVASATDALLVYDAVTKTHVKTVPLAVEHNGRLTRMREPRAIVRSGDTLYVAVFLSGNNTAAVPFRVGGMTSVIADLDKIPGLSLPDADVLALSAVDESVLFHQKAVGTLNFGLHVHETTGKLLVTHLNERNLNWGAGSWDDGKVAEDILTLLTPGDAPEDYTAVKLEDLPGPDGPTSLAFPTDIAVDTQGRIYVAAYSSAAIGVFDANGGFLAILPSDAGPRGLAMTPDGETLYCLNHIAGTITAYDISAGLPADSYANVTIGLFNPTWDRVKAGRTLYYDTSHSGGGSTGCFSCHPDLRTDGMTWELSMYHDVPREFTQEDPPQFWRDRKFPRLTMDQRGLEVSGPWRWRGEIKEFGHMLNMAFMVLLKGTMMTDDDFALVRDFIFSAVYPANPNQMADREPSAMAASGIEVFQRRRCGDCHTLPVGSRGSINAVNAVGFIPPGGENQRSTEAPGYLGLWTKDSDLANIRESGTPLLQAVTGYGYNHSGSIRDLADYVELLGNFRDPRDGFIAGHPTLRMEESERAGMVHFLREIDSGLAPSTHFAYMLNRSTVAGFPGSEMVDQANKGHCDLAARGRITLGENSRSVGLYYDRSRQVFVTDVEAMGTLSLSEILAAVTAGKAEFLFLGVPVWSGERIGVDRDRDGIYDGDEARLGTDPASFDTDGDGFWDSYDDDPLVPNPTVSNTDAPRITRFDVQFVNAATAKIVYETDTFSPTLADFGETLDYGRVVGDPFPLPEGSNHWKRGHSVVLSNLSEDTTYHVRFRTRGQNGVEGEGADFTIHTMKGLLPTHAFTDDRIHVCMMTIMVDHAAETSTVTVMAEISDNHEEEVQGAEIHGVWTVFRDGVPVGQQNAEPAMTDMMGMATISHTFKLLEPGDAVDFTVPMHIGDPVEDAMVGVLDNPATARPFSWPDSVMMGNIKVTIP